MFNSQLKQQIAELTSTNENLQRQYDLVHGLLLQRQDEVVALQRQLSAVQPRTLDIPISFYSGIRSSVKDVLDEEIGVLKDSVSSEVVNRVRSIVQRDLEELLGYDSDSDSDEDEDDSWDD